MAQTGVHGLISLALGRWVQERPGFRLALVLGGLLPNIDAPLLLFGLGGLRHTATHSLLVAGALALLLGLLADALRRPALWSLGLGLGFGIALHGLVDLFTVTSGVALFWPMGGIWAPLRTVVPFIYWLHIAGQAGEFLLAALFLASLWWLARSQGTDPGPRRKLGIWVVAQGLLMLIYMGLVALRSEWAASLHPLLLLVSLAICVGVSLWMRQTIESGAALPIQAARLKAVNLRAAALGTPLSIPLGLMGVVVGIFWGWVIGGYRAGIGGMLVGVIVGLVLGGLLGALVAALAGFLFAGVEVLLFGPQGWWGTPAILWALCGGLGMGLVWGQLGPPSDARRVALTGALVGGVIGLMIGLFDRLLRKTVKPPAEPGEPAG